MVLISKQRFALRVVVAMPLLFVFLMASSQSKFDLKLEIGVNIFAAAKIQNNPLNKPGFVPGPETEPRLSMNFGLGRHYELGRRLRVEQALSHYSFPFRKTIDIHPL
jgi:hypothetical protein